MSKQTPKQQSLCNNKFDGLMNAAPHKRYKSFAATVADWESVWEDSDIYAMFGNILDNAIEATKTVTEEEKRIISLTIGTTGDLLLIDSQNYYAGEIRFVDGLPQTSKENKEYHGFGTRSIKTLTEKYGGDLKISAENGIFRLSIMLPIPT